VYYCQERAGLLCTPVSTEVLHWCCSVKLLKTLSIVGNLSTALAVAVEIVSMLIALLYTALHVLYYNTLVKACALQLYCVLLITQNTSTDNNVSIDT
jgi:hypothetical protein